MVRQLVAQLVSFGVIAVTAIGGREICGWLFITGRLSGFLAVFLGMIVIFLPIIGFVIMKLQCQKAFAVRHDDGRLAFTGLTGPVVPFTQYLRGDFSCRQTIPRIIEVWWQAQGLRQSLVVVIIFCVPMAIFSRTDGSPTPLLGYLYAFGIMVVSTILGGFAGTCRWLSAPMVNVEERVVASNLATPQE